ncbi:hypothetical protein A3860_00375 [Niastella vici]|uniref:Uncharacterized protein n=1 Tax=Niastella vici TaxID=1703345 RepID=A0A1V9G881_9BACT|nr:hypothetical protein A3860_00375 [Niastella vici]
MSFNTNPATLAGLFFYVSVGIYRQNLQFFVVCIDNVNNLPYVHLNLKSPVFYESPYTSYLTSPCFYFPVLLLFE